jgi:hypothetical protein
VVGWIRFPDWPTFNVADSAITCGTLLIAVLAVRGTAVLDGHQAPGGGNKPCPAPAVPGEAGPPTAPVPGPAGPP